MISQQLVSVPDTSLGDLGQYAPQALSDALVQKGYDVGNVGGDLSGATLSGSTLTLADGSSFDLRSGRRISLDASADGVEFSDGQATTIIGGQNVQYTAERTRADAAREIRFNGATAQQVRTFDATPLTFSVASANLAIIDTAVFRDISQSTFTVQNGQLQSATVTSAIDGNTVTMANPIPASSRLVQIRYDQNEKFRIELDKQDQGRAMLAIVPIDPISVGFGERRSVAETGIEEDDRNVPSEETPRGAPALQRMFTDRITFAPTGDDAILHLIADTLPIYRIRAGQLNYTAAFTEILDTSCQLSEAAIHYDAGFIRVVLAPHIAVLCPGARYSYLDQIKEKSYAILNTGAEPYELGLNKNNLLSDTIFLAGLHDDRSHGYVHFPLYLELWGVIQYDRFREFDPNLETRETYQTLNLPFQAVYSSSAPYNHALLNLRGGTDVDLRVDSPQQDPTIPVYAIAESGSHRITEQFFADKVRRFFDYNKHPRTPVSLQRYSSQFLQDKPPISFTDKTLDLRCPAAQNVTLYAEGSAAGKRFADDLSYLSGITFDAYVKKYGGGIAVVGELR